MFNRNGGDEGLFGGMQNAQRGVAGDIGKGNPTPPGTPNSYGPADSGSGFGGGGPMPLPGGNDGRGFGGGGPMPLPGGPKAVTGGFDPVGPSGGMGGNSWGPGSLSTDQPTPSYQMTDYQKRMYGPGGPMDESGGGFRPNPSGTGQSAIGQYQKQQGLLGNAPGGPWGGNPNSYGPAETPTAQMGGNGGWDMQALAQTNPQSIFNEQIKGPAIMPGPPQSYGSPEGGGFGGGGPMPIPGGPTGFQPRPMGGSLGDMGGGPQMGARLPGGPTNRGRDAFAPPPNGGESIFNPQPQQMNQQMNPWLQNYLASRRGF